MITMKHFLSLLAFCALALGIQAQTANTSEACHGDHTVHASNSGFSPSHLTIHAGESVEFIAFNGTHSVDGITNVYTGEPFNNPQDFALPPAYSFWFFGACIGTVDFEVPGTYHYNSTTTGNAGSITVLGDEQPSNTVVDIVVNSPCTTSSKRPSLRTQPTSQEHSAEKDHSRSSHPPTTPSSTSHSTRHRGGVVQPRRRNRRRPPCLA